MVEGTHRRVSSEEGDIPASSSQGVQLRRRKKRKWDQPAESFIPQCVTAPIFPHVGSAGAGSINTQPGIVSLANDIAVTNPLLGSLVIPLPASQILAVPQDSAKPKAQDDLLIAREIVINDAEPAVRYQLTRRQTQEEIQKCTGAIVITRGKYHHPNAPLDSEKPLYLHISAVSHLNDTTSRILAVDRAAAMVEEILKSGANPALLGQSSLRHEALSACVYLGFDADPSLNVASRICGPNDQYLKHIVNETGATVILKGHGLEASDEPEIGSQGSLHLFISANNAKSLEDAKLLSENLLDTIASECGLSRVSSSVAFAASPAWPPQFRGPVGINPFANVTSPNKRIPLSPGSSVASCEITPPSTELQNGAVSQPSSVGHFQPFVSGGTSYSGYGGIYPQATPLQQVAIALKQSTCTLGSTVPPARSASTTFKNPSVNDNCDMKSLSQKRKFKELPLNARPNIDKGMKTSSLEDNSDLKRTNEQRKLPPPNVSRHLPSNVMPPPPPPPPRFTPSEPRKDGNFISSSTAAVPDTLVKADGVWGGGR